MPAPVRTTPSLVRRDRRTAGWLLLAGVGAVLIGLAEDVTIGGVTSAWWHLLPAAVGAAGVTVQRRFPLPVLAIALVATLLDLAWGWSLATVLVLWEVLYTAALAWPRPWVEHLRRLTMGAAVVVLLAGGIVFRDVREAVNVGLLALAVLVMPVSWGREVRQQADLAELAARNAEHDRQAAVREERARMARDLHDAVAGDLASIAIQAEGGLRHAAPSSPERNALNAIRASGVRAVGELTRMITLLRREGGDEQAADDVTTAPGLDLVDDLVQHAQRSGLAVRAEVDVPPGLPAAVDHAAYRIVQEALTNASRHGGGEARVRVCADDDALGVEVRSRGRRTDSVAGSGLGLLTMRERAEGLGGDFESGWEGTGSGSDDWWLVRARIPVDA